MKKYTASLSEQFGMSWDSNLSYLRCEFAARGSPGCMFGCCSRAMFPQTGSLWVTADSSPPRGPGQNYTQSSNRQELRSRSAQPLSCFHRGTVYCWLSSGAVLSAPVNKLLLGSTQETACTVFVQCHMLPQTEEIS